jgi:hypothetical protein
MRDSRTRSNYFLFVCDFCVLAMLIVLHVFDSVDPDRSCPSVKCLLDRQGTDLLFSQLHEPPFSHRRIAFVLDFSLQFREQRLVIVLVVLMAAPRVWIYQPR